MHYLSFKSNKVAILNKAIMIVTLQYMHMDIKNMLYTNFLSELPRPSRKNMDSFLNYLILKILVILWT